MILGKNHVSTTTIAAAFVVALTSGCGTDAPTRILDPGPPAPSRSGAPFHSSPDRLEQQGNPSSTDRCVFSADMAERLGRPVCVP